MPRNGVQVNTKMMEMNELELLGRIQPVDPPPFLLTRIEARISAERVERMPASWGIGLALGMLLLVTVNSVAYQNRTGNKSSASSDVEQLAGDLSLSPSEQLYR